MMKIRQAAAAAGLSRYFTGKPCKHGHLSDRQVANGQCCECHRISQTKVNAKYDRIAPKSGPTTRGITGRTSKTVCDLREAALNWSKSNPEKVKAYSRNFYETFKEEVNRRALSNRHLREKGITLEQYEVILSQHDGKCDICGTTEPGGRHGKFNLDHCHSSGQLRGILCMRCNTTLGKFEDDPELFRKAIDYLNAPPRRHEIYQLLESEVKQMGDFRHLMLDIESMGTRPNAPIISIGAVKFDPSTGSLGQEFYRQIDLESACKWGVPSGSTIKWWLEQGTDARKAAAEGNYPLPQALDHLKAFCNDWRDVQVWANDPDFDCVILEYAYFKTGSSHPWAFWNKRSCRTIAELAGKRPPKHQGVAHNALEDAKHQAHWVSDFWQQIKGVKKVAPVGDGLDDL